MEPERVDWTFSWGSSARKKLVLRMMNNPIKSVVLVFIIFRFSVILLYFDPSDGFGFLFIYATLSSTTTVPKQENGYKKLEISTIEIYEVIQ